MLVTYGVLTRLEVSVSYCIRMVTRDALFVSRSATKHKTRLLLLLLMQLRVLPLHTSTQLESGLTSSASPPPPPTARFSV